MTCKTIVRNKTLRTIIKSFKGFSIKYFGKTKKKDVDNQWLYQNLFRPTKNTH